MEISDEIRKLTGSNRWSISQGREKAMHPPKISRYRTKCALITGQYFHPGARLVQPAGARCSQSPEVTQLLEGAPR